MRNFWLLLKKLKIKKDDHLIVHSSFKRLGSEGVKPDWFLNKVQNYLTKGTLIFPTFTWRTSKKTKKFDYFKSVSEMGILSETFRKKNKNNRTFHPTHSIVASGKDQSNIINFSETNRSKGPCGRGTVWEYLIKKNTKVLLIDCFIESCTLIHYFEEIYNPNLFLKKKINNYICKDKNNEKKSFNLRDHAFGKRSFKKIYFELKKRNAVEHIFFKDISFLSFSSINLKKTSNYLFKKDKKASI